MSDVAGPPEPPKRVGWKWVVFFPLISISVVAGFTTFFFSWGLKAPIEPRGGLLFPWRVELEVPLFRQDDERWGEDSFGRTGGTLGAEGCAVASAAMVLASYGVDTDPKRLNAFLQEKEGYTPEGWIYWEKAAELAPEKVKHVYEDLPSYQLIDTNLMRGNPVIVRMRKQEGTTHFVVIAGKDGFDYLTRDPGAEAGKGLYPLREIGSRIEALRIYEQLQ